MLITVLLFAIILAVLGAYVSHDAFAPYVAVPTVWIVAILIYLFMPSTLYPICNNFPLALLIWLLGFSISSICSERYTPACSQASRARTPNRKILNAYIVITWITIPVICSLYIWQAITEDPQYVFRYLRMMSTGQDDNITPPNLGILMYLTSLSFICLFFAFLYTKNKWVIGSIVGLNLLFAITTMAKTSLLSVFFSSLCLCYFIKKISIKQIVMGMTFFVIACFVLQTVRQGSEEMETNSFLSLYLSSSMVAFDYFTLPASSIMLGEHTFRIIYAIGHAIGFTEAPTDTILPFVSVPDITNTYTNLYPFYVDFGMLGVFFFSIVYGGIYGYLYKKSKTGGKLELILYAVFLTFILMEFIGEFIFTNLSTFLQYIFFTALPFMFNKQAKTR